MANIHYFYKEEIKDILSKDQLEGLDFENEGNREFLLYSNGSFEDKTIRGLSNFQKHVLNELFDEEEFFEI